MIEVVAATLLSPLVLGGLTAWALSRQSAGWERALPLLACLGLGMGLAITSTAFFFASWVSGHPGRVDAALELLVALALAAWIGLHRPERSPRSAGRWQPRSHPYWQLGLATLVLQSGLAGALVVARNRLAGPYGGWDASAIWNLHARMMFRAVGRWPDLLRAPQIAWSHPDYPLFLPASVARAWTLLGGDGPEAPGVLAIALGVATCALLVAAVAHLRGLTAAFLGGLVLLGTPFFATFSTSQYADIPLGYFILGALVLLVLGDRSPASRVLPLGAGAFAAMTAWTKNEGWLFVLVAVLAWSVLACRRRSTRQLGPFLAGLGIALIPVILFKIAIAPPNDLVASRPLERAAQLFDPGRHRLILSALWHHGAQFGGWRIAPYLGMLLALASGPWRRLAPGEWAVGAAVLLMLFGYYAVYLLTPNDLAWHLENSIDRLLLQLWPAGILCWCLATFGGEEIPTGAEPLPAAPERPSRRLPLFALVNLLAAGAVIGAFRRQLAPNELARTSNATGAIHAVMETGWYGREAAGGHTWAWSSGHSTLQIIPSGPPEGRGFDRAVQGSEPAEPNRHGSNQWEDGVDRPNRQGPFGRDDSIALAARRAARDHLFYGGTSGP